MRLHRRLITRHLVLLRVLSLHGRLPCTLWHWRIEIKLILNLDDHIAQLHVGIPIVQRWPNVLECALLDALMSHQAANGDGWLHVWESIWKLPERFLLER
jgi:hypothetical protein